jgi:hypothetical protein
MTTTNKNITDNERAMTFWFILHASASSACVVMGKREENKTYIEELAKDIDAMMLLDARYNINLKHKIAELKSKFELYEKQNDNLFEELLDLEKIAINAYEKLIEQGFSDLALKTITEILGFADDYTEFNGWYSHREHMVDEFFTEKSVDMDFASRRHNEYLASI